MDRASSSGPRRATPIALYAAPAALVALVFVGMYATSSDTIEGEAANGTLRIQSFVDRQYDAFMDVDKAPPSDQARLTSSRSSRSEAYRVAMDGFRDRPLGGQGAASYRIRWMRDRDVSEDTKNAHSLELETLTELGLVGVLLLAGVLVPLGAGARKMRRAPSGLSRTQAAAAAGVVVVWLVHSALDWDWQMAAVTLPALACGATLLTSGSRRRRPNVL